MIGPHLGVRPFFLAMPDTPSRPAASLVAQLRTELMRHQPFSRMAPAHVDRFIIGSRQAYYAPGEVVLEPASGPVTELLLLRQGSISGQKGLAEAAGSFEYGPGDLFPVGALLAARPVTARYTANEDSFCLHLALAEVQALVAESPPFADFLNGRVARLLALSRQAVQAHWSQMALAEQALETPLSRLKPKVPLACEPHTPLAQALQRMHDAHVGSVLVVDAAGAPQGILTRHDILGRVTLPRLPLNTAVSQVMSSPVRSLSGNHTLQDAALLMSQHGVRHVPVTEDGRLVNIVSERDLFALQRLSLKQLGMGLRAAPDVAALQALAPRIHDLARQLLGQGVQARQITEIISHLNDLLTQRLVALVATKRGVDLGRACWLAFGSEGRAEQTVATDQDNGLVFDSPTPDAERVHWLAFGQEVNDALAACGYPLCKGGVMAGNAACCLTTAEWQQRFERWIDHGAPEDLLNASIYFDLRPLAGNAALAEPLQQVLRAAPPAVPRFMKQMADNALRRPVPLNWRGALDTQTRDGQELLDLKLQGTAIFVDAARLFALARGLPQQNTRARFEAAAPLMAAPARESEAWVAAFEFLQMQRLQVQLDRPAHGDKVNPNEVDVRALNDIDRRVLKESMRVARGLQQRLALDYGGV
jgi:CBS domain-containing protein